jgi:hypothetical protein
MQVLSNAAQRVAEVKHEQEMANAQTSLPPPQAEMASLDKQQHVLSLTATVMHQVTTQHPFIPPPAPGVQQVAEAAREMVFQAAHTSLMQKQVGVEEQKLAGTIPLDTITDPVTVNEVTATTQSAVAEAVKITGPGVSEVTVLMTARNLLQQQEQAMTVPLEIAPQGMIPPVQFSSQGSIHPSHLNTPLPDYGVV